jgi:pimeloyl-ACP methyl ester carboxylesterase
MTEAMVRVNGVELCVESFGDSQAPAILLIGGGASSMDWWEDEFCSRLAAEGRFVIRYDHRDTGRSVSSPPGKPDYTGADLFADALGLIDTVAGGRAHVVGLSMGGGIAQYLAMRHPERIATLTLVSTSPGTGDLPPPTERLRAVFADPPPDPDWADHEAVLEHLVDGQRPFAGPDSFDEAAVRVVARRVVERTVNPESSAKNHWLVVGDDHGESPGLAAVTAPTLVIHGTDDPLFPQGHADALVREIADAELLLLDGVGHQVPPRSTWDVVLPAIVRHTAPEALP